MKPFMGFFMVALLAAVSGCRSGTDSSAQHRPANEIWRGVHLIAHNDHDVALLIDELPKLAADGVNVLVVEVNYGFDFQSHPELRPSQFITKSHAHELAKAARAQGIRLIPELDCLGHQSWSKNTLPLLAKYPQFDETPGQFPDN